jgi:hypothetical protein
VLFDKENARNPINRRISIIVMTQKAEAEAMRIDTSTAVTPAMTPAGEAAGAAAVPATAGDSAQNRS